MIVMVDPSGQARSEAVDERPRELVETAARLRSEREIEDDDAALEIARFRQLARSSEFKMRSHEPSDAQASRSPNITSILGTVVRSLTIVSNADVH